MKTFKNKKGKEFLLIEVPADAYGFSNDLSSNQIDYIEDTEYNAGILKMSSAIVLPQGNYQLIGLAKDVSEEVAKEIVDRDQLRIDLNFLSYENYTNNSLFFEHATEILSSLIKSLGLNNNVLILEKGKLSC